MSRSSGLDLRDEARTRASPYRMRNAHTGSREHRGADVAGAPTGRLEPRVELLLLGELGAAAEALDLATGVHDPLLPREEGVADAADLGVQCLLSGTGGERVPTGTAHRCVVEVLGMNCLHDYDLSLPGTVRS